MAFPAIRSSVSALLEWERAYFEDRFLPRGELDFSFSLLAQSMSSLIIWLGAILVLFGAILFWFDAILVWFRSVLFWFGAILVWSGFGWLEPCLTQARSSLKFCCLDFHFRWLDLDFSLSPVSLLSEPDPE